MKLQNDKIQHHRPVSTGPERNAIFGPLGLGRSLVALAVLSVTTSAAFGQSKIGVRGKTAPDPAEIARKMAEYEKGSVEKQFLSPDGVYMTMTYWRAKKPGDTTPVVILCHMLGRTQRDWLPFAKQLHDSKEGFAVVTFDFRGHGESVHINPEKYKSPEDIREEAKLAEYRRRTGNRIVIPGSRQQRDDKSSARGDTINYRDDFRSTKELAEMMVRDLEYVKKELIGLHNNHEFNIRLLGIVGAQLSCNVTLNWMKEYEFARPKIGWNRQGGDLLAVVLLSPDPNFEGVRAETRFEKEADDVRMLLVSSDDRKVERNVGRLAKTLRIPESSPSKRKDYYRPDSLWMKVKSSLVGTQLLTPQPVEKVDLALQGYLEGRLHGVIGREWRERSEELEIGFGGAR